MNVRLIKLASLTACFVAITSMTACSSDSTADIRIGSEARLRGGSETTIVAIDQKSLQDFVKAGLAKDEYGMKELIAKGKIFSMPSYTNVLVIDTSSIGAVKVRVLEGIHVGEALWTDMTWLTKDNAPLASQRTNNSTNASNATPEHYFVKPQKPGDNEFGISLEGQLLNAASSCDIAELTKLLDKGVDVNAGADGGVTPLGFAVKEGCIDGVKLLLGRGANVNARNTEYGATALMWACMSKGDGATEIAKMLLANGADVNAKDNDGWTVLRWAKKYKNQNTIRVVKESGGK